MGLSRSSLVPAVSFSCLAEWMAKAEKAALDGKATSGAQRVNFTVLSSTASMDLNSPP